MAVLRRGCLFILAATLATLLLAASAQAGTPARVEVVVELNAPPLARAVASSRVLSVGAKTRRLSLSAPVSVSYLRSLTLAQQRVERRIVAAIPTARVRWRYSVVLNGLAVTVPAGDEARLASVPGVAHVYPRVRYRQRLDRSPEVIGAPALWGTDFSTAGGGVKIGIIDDGIDQTHPFFNPSGFMTPAGFPKGDTAFTTAKVIVARAFAPPSPAWKFAARPFDPENSQHATHVAGIAAGDRGLVPSPGRAISGVAPAAYLGNYKVLTIPTDSGVGLDGNSPEIAAGIEAAVRDGMDVINLSLGEPEIEPARDLVVEAIDAAADAGVVPVIAAGNDFDEFGLGSIGSPGSAPKAITAAAATKGGAIAGFSSSGPTPVSLQLKPDVTAPGVSILSSIPPRGASPWTTFSGTSMASPHVAAAAALLRERHPEWTVAQIKSALVLTGDPVYTDEAHTSEVPATREGGGLIDLPHADTPLLFAQPTGLAFGLIRTGASATLAIDLTDAGGGAGIWSVTVAPQASPAGASVTAPATVTVPGRLEVTATADAGAISNDLTGFVVLGLGDQVRRIPYWLRVTDPALGREPHGILRRTGTYQGDTTDKPALVSSYRYPADPAPLGVPTQLAGPEQVFRVTLARPVANFGVAVLSRSRGVRVSPRVVVAGDENRLTGYSGLPLNLNPYLQAFEQPEPVAGAILPAAGAYDVVFDTPSQAAAGRFTFRFWIDDTTPPRLRLLARAVPRGGRLRFALSDAGSGVDPGSLHATVDGREFPARYSAQSEEATISVGGLRRGRHRVVLQASDYQEAKNMENVPLILPNTTKLAATFRIR